MFSFEKWIAGAALVGLVSFAAAPASATPNFPGVIATNLGLDAAPDCVLCHVGATKVGTVTTPFGVSMLSRGLVAYDEGSLSLALQALDGEEKDSDGDGVTDLDELRSGEDPNVAAGGTAPLAPEYGCSVASPGSQSTPALGGTSALLALAALAAFVRRSASRKDARVSR
ncbi:thrombospondin type 3 repeat-containing protein [Chondromyces apiculatus]|uniref:Cytochrome c domain-containing protein n=1 Tax=Chondromyces apiculatus DSM 436 TaxID=1192034 RepID=A0A017TAC6_9BACT|nr:thrombospondin type 3 repeat-containing protein [Chondromyces apiculatus]EYF06238.1 Hypothetical protein CAP_2116 [Chondromyces apiculatus DSM 436]